MKKKSGVIGRAVKSVVATVGPIVVEAAATVANRFIAKKTKGKATATATTKPKAKKAASKPAAKKRKQSAAK